MIGHYLKSAYANALRDKQYLIINVMGLAIALSAVILIALFVRDEVSYDKWLEGHERIYKIENTVTFPGSPTVLSTSTPGPLAPALVTNFNEDIEAAIRLYRNETSVRVGAQQFNEIIDYVDAAFFDVFDLPFVSGDRAAVLQSGNTIAINETMARKYFGDQNPIGKTFDINHSPSASRIDYQVVGVFKDLPHNSHLNSSFIALLVPDRYEAWPWVTQDWSSANTHSYVKLMEKTDIDTFRTRLDEFAMTLPIPTGPGMSKPLYTFSLLNAADIHLYSEALRPFKLGGDITTVNTFAMIAILILLMASINFTNLASAQAIKRSREVSIRKVLGARRVQLITQFLSESVLTSIFALIISMTIIELLLPTYNAFLGKDISLYLDASLVELAALIGFAILVGIAAGAYPAFVSSSFRPAKVLQSNKSAAPDSARLRHILLVVQFTISIALIISMMIIYAQTIYSQNIDAGFEKKNRLTLSGAGYNQVAPASSILKQELAKIPGVSLVGVSSDTFPNKYGNFSDISFPANAASPKASIQTMYMGPDFLKSYAVSPIAGRNFSNQFRNDFPVEPTDTSTPITRGAIINESLLKLSNYGSAEEAIGKQLSMGRDRITNITIVGVIKDLHVSSTRESTSPQIFFVTESGLDFLTLELQEKYSAALLRQISAVWNEHLPNVPMISTLSIDAFEALYIAEMRRATIFAIFSALSIIISSIGLYGLAAFVAESRTREIGIRKVLGATVLDIIKLLLLQFSKPILVANFIAWPVAYLNMDSWLNAFAYRIDISLAYFLFAAFLTLIIAWSVVAGHAINVARKSPIEALRIG